MHAVLKKYLDAKIKLSPEHEVLVDNCFEPKLAKRNEILVANGAVARYIYFVVKGCLRIFLINEDGTEPTRFLVFEGHIGTAFPSFILGEPSSAGVQALKASE